MQMPVKSLSPAEHVPSGTASGDVAWLAAHAMEPNFTLMPQWLEPLVSHCAGGRSLMKSLVLSDDGRPGGFVALQERRWRWGLPVRHAETFFGDFPISGTPLLNPADPAGAAARLLEDVFCRSRASAVVLSHVSGHHAVSSVLVDACAGIGAPIRFFNDRKRAALRCNGDHDAWFDGTFARKRRKEFRRLKSRLAEQGELVFEVSRPEGSALDAWITDFCKLENSGWKGRAGTAIAKSGALTAFLKDSLSQLSRAGKLVCWSLALDGKPVAMMFGVCEGATCWIVKIARDEAFDRFSPGQLLILDVTRWLFDQDAILFADSCAEPGHPMIDHLWKDRLDVRDVLIGKPGQPAVMFAAIAMLERARRSARRHLKSIRNRLIKGVSR